MTRIDELKNELKKTEAELAAKTAAWKKAKTAYKKLRAEYAAAASKPKSRTSLGKNGRRLMAPKERYFGTPEEIDEIERKHAQGEPLTLDETSKVMGLSRSAIKAIEARALQHLKEELQKRFGANVKLDDFIDIGACRQSAARFQPEAEG